jgi:hypothetical protein
MWLPPYQVSIGKQAGSYKGVIKQRPAREMSALDVRFVPIADVCRRHQAVTTFARFIVAIRALDLSPTADIQIAFHTGFAPAHSGAAR